MGLVKREFARGTFLVQSYPWGGYVAGAAECCDGKVRKLKRIAATADTFFSVPASVTVKGKTVAGYISTECVSGSSVETAADPAIVRFHAYTPRINGHMLAGNGYPGRES